MGLPELIALVLAAAAAGFVGLCLYRAATRPADDGPEVADDLPPDDDPTEPEDGRRSPVELL